MISQPLMKQIRFGIASCLSTALVLSMLGCSGNKKPHTREHLLNSPFQGVIGTLDLSKRPSKSCLLVSETGQYALKSDGYEYKGSVLHGSSLDLISTRSHPSIHRIRLSYAAAPLDRPIEKRDYLGALLLAPKPKEIDHSHPLSSLFQARPQTSDITGTIAGVIGLESGGLVTPDIDGIDPMLVIQSDDLPNSYTLYRNNEFKGLALSLDERFFASCAGWMSWEDYQARLKWIVNDPDLFDQFIIAYAPLKGNTRIPAARELIAHCQGLFAQARKDKWQEAASDVAHWEKAYQNTSDLLTAYQLLLDQHKIIAKYVDNQGIIPEDAMDWRRSSVTSWSNRIKDLLGPGDRTIRTATYKSKKALRIKADTLFVPPSDLKSCIAALTYAQDHTQIHDENLWLCAIKRLEHVFPQKPIKHNPSKDIKMFTWKTHVEDCLGDIKLWMDERTKGEHYNRMSEGLAFEQGCAVTMSNLISMNGRYSQYWDGMLRYFKSIYAVNQYLQRPLDSVSLAEEKAQIIALIPAEKNLRQYNSVSKLGKKISLEVSQRLDLLAEHHLARYEKAGAKKLAQLIRTAGSLDPATNVSIH